MVPLAISKLYTFSTTVPRSFVLIFLIIRYIAAYVYTFEFLNKIKIWILYNSPLYWCPKLCVLILFTKCYWINKSVLSEVHEVVTYSYMVPWNKLDVDLSLRHSLLGPRLTNYARIIQIWCCIQYTILSWKILKGNSIYIYNYTKLGTIMVTDWLWWKLNLSTLHVVGNYLWHYSLKNKQTNELASKRANNWVRHVQVKA